MSKSLKNVLKSIVALSLALAMLAGCSAPTDDSGSSTPSGSDSSSESDNGGETSGDTKDTLSFFLPLTGEQMQYGESLKNGAELSLELFNEANGTDYKMEVFDDKGDPKEAVNVANLIIANPNSIAGMGSFSSSCAMAAAPVFEENDMVLLSPNASHTDFPAMGENMFSAVMSQKYEGSEFANFLFETYGAQNIAIIHQNTDHGVLATDVFVTRYEELGGTITIIESFIPGQSSDFTPVLSKIKELEPDVIYANASYNDCAQIFLQARGLNMDQLLVGPGMLLTDDFLDVIGTEIDNLVVMASIPSYLPSSIEAGNLDTLQLEFVEAYVEKFGENPDGFAACAYDAVNIMLSSVEKVGTDSAALREEIASIRDYEGVSGRDMSFNDNKEMVKGIYAFEVVDGDFVQIN